MQLHHLKPKTERKSSKRVGRGGKRGTYSGKGMKGQKSRAGHKLPKDALRIISKFPKLRGVHNTATSIKVKSRAINVGVLSARIGENAHLTPGELVKRGIIKKPTDPVKILGGGEVRYALTLKGIPASKQAKEKLERAGGAVQA